MSVCCVLYLRVVELISQIEVLNLEFIEVNERPSLVILTMFGSTDMCTRRCM